jgi:predicted RNase H-related nuclease YkuK (DUF458 family)
MLNKAIKAIKASSQSSSIYVGCDSVRFKKKVNGRTQWFARYATVVVVHMDSCHGCKLFYKEDILPDYGKKTESLIARLLNEATFAIEATQAIAPHLGDRHFEVHLDINADEVHASNRAASQASGYVLGVTGVKPKIKPEAFAAMFAADRIANNRLRNQIR